MKKNVLIALFAFITAVIGISAGIFAESATMRSKGVFLFDNGTSDTSDDVIFDANDLVTINNSIINGKNDLSEKINELSNNTTTLTNTSSFSDLVSGLEEISTYQQSIGYEKGKNDYKPDKQSSKVGLVIGNIVNDYSHNLGQATTEYLDGIASSYIQESGSSASSTGNGNRYLQYKVLQDCQIKYTSTANGRDLSRPTRILEYGGSTLFTDTAFTSKFGVINATANNYITFRSNGYCFQSDTIILEIWID